MKKAHDSDNEEEIQVSPPPQTATELAKISKEEFERRQLENAPVIADSEISPAAYLFNN
jgi:hypothetical protein